MKLRSSLLQELAMRENVSKGLSPDKEVEVRERPDGTLEGKRHEIMEALKTLV